MSGKGGLIPTANQAKKIVYDLFITTCGTIVVAYGVQKAFRKKLGVPMTLEGAAITGGAVISNYLQMQKILPEEV